MTWVQTATASEAVPAALLGIRHAAAEALQLDYRGLAAALEDLAAVLAAVPPQDADRVARALVSGARH